MAHIEDRWHRIVKGPDGKPVKQRTARYGTGKRWRARYLDPDDQERNRSFDTKVMAEKFLTEVEHAKIAGTYRDPDAGRVTLGSRIPLWLDSLTCDPTTRHHIELRVQRHIMPAFGHRRLDVLARSPSIIQAWAANLPVGASYAQQLLADLSGILEQAVTDSLIPRNPVKAANIRVSRVVRRKIVPWTAGQVDAIRGELPGRYQAMTDVGRYLGLRQGEIFGVSLDEVDWLRRVVHVNHQVKLFMAVTPVYGPPKGNKPRDVPLPGQAAEALAAHLERHPAVEVTLPWQSPDGKPRTFALIFTGDKGGPCNRAAFNSKIWVPARRRAGIPDRAEDEGGTGMHQLRHHFASTLLRGGVDIKRVQAWLGHHSAAFTIDVYGHLMPDDHEASLRQIEAIFAGPFHSAPDGPEAAQPGTRGQLERITAGQPMPGCCLR
jgi:integrase